MSLVSFFLALDSATSLITLPELFASLAEDLPFTLKTPTKVEASSVIDSVARQVLQQVEGQIRTQEAMLRDCADKMKKLTLLNKDSFTFHLTTLHRLQKEIQKAQKDLAELNRTVIMRPLELYQSGIMKQSLVFQYQRSELYYSEIGNLAAEDDKTYVNLKGLVYLYGGSVATLAITQQPFDQVLFKQRVTDSQYCVDLVCGTRSNIEKASAVQAVLSDEESFKCAKPIDNDKKNFDEKNRATFPDIKINVSTRMVPVYLRFQCHVMEKNKKAVVPLSSPYSNPFIVITNESQWPEAAAKLFSLAVFGQNPKVKLLRNSLYLGKGNFF